MNKKLKRIILAIIILIAIALVLRFLIGGNEDTWMCSAGDWIKYGNPASPMPSEVCG